MASRAGFSHARANPSTAQTFAALVPARSNSAPKVSYIYISSDTEMTFSLFDSVSLTLVWRFYVGARGGQSINTEFQGLEGEGFVYSTSASGNIFIDVEYGYTR